MTLEEATDKLKFRMFEMGEMVEKQRAQIELFTLDYHAMLGGLQELEGLLAIMEPVTPGPEQVAAPAPQEPEPE